VAHEIFGDGIISAIDCSLDLKKVVEEGVARAVFTFNGKWLVYRKF
jgi:cyanate lyase